MKILVTGAAGQLGTELQRYNWPIDHDLIALDRAALDITNAKEISVAIENIDCVINTAAYTKVDDAENNRDLAFQVNAKAPGLLATACALRDIPLIHVSTDYVFDNSELRPIDEDVMPNPVNIYARSKLAGEDAVRTATTKHLILRVGWLYASHGHNFLRTMLKLGAERDELHIVNDQYGIPTAACNVAAAIAVVISYWQRDAAPDYGTFHYADRGLATWFQFAQEIFSAAKECQFEAPELLPINTSAYPTPAKRPHYSVLDGRRFDQRFGTTRTDWRVATKDVVFEILAKNQD